MALSRFAARVLTGTSLAVGAALLLLLDGLCPPGSVPFAVAALLAALAAWELTRMGRFAAGALALPLGLAWLAVAGGTLELLRAPRAVAGPRELGWSCLLALGAAGFGHALTRPRAAQVTLPRAGLWAMGLALWSLPAVFALVLIDLRFGTEGVAVLIVLAKVGDNAGYFIGRKFGRRHPFPRISPGKTVAGCVASLAAGIVAGMLLLPLTLGERTPAQLLLGALVGGVVNVAAQASDLSESWVKRQAGVKDSSGLVGPSGGVLDVIDSLFLAAPASLLLWAWVY